MYVRGSDKNIEYKRDLNGFFRGIIMSDADPIELYRCKIFVPEIHELVYDTVEGREKVRYYIAPDELGSLQPDDHKQLIETLPWAEQASSLFGEQGLSHYNASRGTQTPGTNYDTGSRRTNTPNAQEMNTYVSQTLASSDIVKGSSGSDTNAFNPTGQASVYMPAPNAPNAHGIHGIPSVGAHVWVFFDRGDINCPVYFAACPSAAETNQVFHDRQYPDGYSDNYKESANVDDTPPEPRSSTSLPAGGGLNESTVDGPNVGRRTAFDRLTQREKRTLLELAEWEIGNGSERSKIAFMETVANRAAARGVSVDTIVSSRGYYRDFWSAKSTNSIPPGRALTASKANEWNRYFNTVSNGSNITWGATDNASDAPGNPLKTNIINGASIKDANQGSFVEIDGELFYSKSGYRSYLNRNGFNPDNARNFSRQTITANTGTDLGDGGPGVLPPRTD